MSNIKYNEREEAFELPYKIWDEKLTVRFYVEEESEIMKNLSVIAEKLAKVDGSKSQIAGVLIDEGWYEGGSVDALANILKIQNVYVDIDDDEIVACFETGTDDGYMQGMVKMELYGELFEAVGWV